MAMDMAKSPPNALCVNPAHLRLVTNKQNAENHSGARKNSLTGARGVNHRNGRFTARVMNNGRQHHLGMYDTLEEAAEAARQGRLRFHSHNDLDRIPRGM